MIDDIDEKPINATNKQK